MSVLEASGQVYLLQPYFKNFGKRVIKSPKLYFLDTAVATFLTGLHSEEAILQGPSAGALMETAFVAEWVKVFHNRGEPPSLYYWRSSDGLEVDLLVDRNGRLHAFEVKTTATVTPAHALGLRRWQTLAAAEPRGTVAIVADVENAFSLQEGIRVVPWWMR